MYRPRLFTELLLLVFVTLTVHPERRSPADEPAGACEVGGARLVVVAPQKRVEVTTREWETLPKKTVSLADRDGIEATYEGVLLSELLKLVGGKFGGDLRGAELARYVVVEAADKYRVVFSLPELDGDATGQMVLIANRRDGKPMDEMEGPYRVIVPHEKRHARWVRRVITIRLEEAKSPDP